MQNTSENIESETEVLFPAAAEPPSAALVPAGAGR
jgi:hypothetical protein